MLYKRSFGRLEACQNCAVTRGTVLRVEVPACRIEGRGEEGNGGVLAVT